MQSEINGPEKFKIIRTRYEVTSNLFRISFHQTLLTKYSPRSLIPDSSSKIIQFLEDLHQFPYPYFCLFEKRFSPLKFGLHP